jgi:DNA mismatch repair protein MutL
MQQLSPDKQQNRTINILPDFISNQIAAGEVVQRPESVIKELVENSFDAGADSVVVVVKDSGKQLIHIVDNGRGMSREDLELSIKRHATSKIYTQDDLESIRTFGFRGEALASITSVAYLELRSRRKEDEYGWKLVSEPMKEPVIEPINMDPGTQVFVRNLFYNVPARRKFLKSNITEFRYISDTMIRFALSNINHRLTFYDDDTLIFDVKPETLESRIHAILGDKTAKALIKVKSEHYDVSLNGFIGQPHVAKQTKSGQYLFLNGRSIVSKSLSYAVYTAFEHLLEKSANPLFVLNLAVDPSKYDVNVHPQKHEVKFEDERIIYSLIHRAVSSALIESNLAPGGLLGAEDFRAPFIQVNTSTGAQNGQERVLVNSITGEIINNTSSNANFYNRNSYQSNNSHFTWKNESRPDPSAVQSAFDLVFSGRNNNNNGDNYNQLHKFNTPRDQDITESKSSFWQLHRKYLFVQNEKGVLIIDQHAAHERIIYERTIKSMEKHFASTQELLFPVEIKLTPSEVTFVKELENDLKDLGYIFRINQDNTIEISGVPIDATNGNEANSFKEILDLYDEYQKVRNTNRRDNLAASFSCKSAIKTGQSLSQEEIQHLYDDLMKCEIPYACPHGRPVIVELSLMEFDKKFGRIL